MSASFWLSAPERIEPAKTMMRGGVPSRAILSSAPVEPDPRRRDVHPDPGRSLRREASWHTGDRPLDQIGELDERLARVHPGEAGLDQPDPIVERPHHQRQARDDRRHSPGPVAQRAVEVIGVALDDRDAGKTLADEPAELRAVLDGDDPLRVHAAIDQRPGDDAGPRPEFDDRQVVMRVDMARHRPGQRRAGGADRAGYPRPRDKPAQEPQFVAKDAGGAF